MADDMEKLMAAEKNSSGGKAIGEGKDSDVEMGG
jgi:hypothetical protein